MSCNGWINIYLCRTKLQCWCDACHKKGWKHIKDKPDSAWNLGLRSKCLSKYFPSNASTTTLSYFWMSLFLPSFPLTSPSLPPLSWAHTSFVRKRWRRNKGGGKMGHITLLKAVYFASLSLAHSPSFFISIFLCLPDFFLPLSSFSLLFPLFSQVSVLRFMSPRFLSSLPSCVCSGSHVASTERGRVRQRERESARAHEGEMTL